MTDSPSVEVVTPRELRERAEAALRGLAHLIDDTERMGPTSPRPGDVAALVATARRALRVLGSFLAGIGRGDEEAARKFQRLYAATYEGLSDVRADLTGLREEEPIFYSEWLFWMRTFFGDDVVGDGPRLGRGGALVPSPVVAVTGAAALFAALLWWLGGSRK